MASVNSVKDKAANEALQTAHRISQASDRGPFGGFKKFIARGSMVDMAVGVVMGAAVSDVVNSLVKNLISPLVAMLFGKPDLSNLMTITYRNATISFGAILTALINFILVAAAIYFCVILPINKLRDLGKTMSGAKDQPPAGPSTEEQTLQVLKSIADDIHQASSAEPTAEHASLPQSENR